MYSVSSELYRETAERLMEAIGPAGYYSGTLSFGFGEAECRLVVSAIVYCERRLLPEGAVDLLRDLVPVWWEFHTETAGEERFNDFSFAELRRYLG